MIRTLRAFFLGRLLREKLLLVAFFVIGVLMWFSGYSKRLGRHLKMKVKRKNIAKQFKHKKVLAMSKTPGAGHGTLYGKDGTAGRYS
jgi:hypothetical protein